MKILDEHDEVLGRDAHDRRLGGHQQLRFGGVVCEIILPRLVVGTALCHGLEFFEMVLQRRQMLCEEECTVVRDDLTHALDETRHNDFGFELRDKFFWKWQIQRHLRPNQALDGRKILIFGDSLLHRSTQMQSATPIVSACAATFSAPMSPPHILPRALLLVLAEFLPHHHRQDS